MGYYHFAWFGIGAPLDIPVFHPGWMIIIRRLLMYLPFALYIGVVMQWKPRLLFLFFHTLMDLSALAVDI